MKYILAYKEDLSFEGFYVEGIHMNIPIPNLTIDKDLWSYLLTLGDFKILEVLDKEYTVGDKDLFEKIELPQDILPPQEPSIIDRVDVLEVENAELLLSSVEHELRTNVIEQDIADLMFEISTMKMEVV